MLFLQALDRPEVESLEELTRAAHTHKNQMLVMREKCNCALKSPNDCCHTLQLPRCIFNSFPAINLSTPLHNGTHTSHAENTITFCTQRALIFSPTHKQNLSHQSVRGLLRYVTNKHSGLHFHNSCGENRRHLDYDMMIQG